MELLNQISFWMSILGIIVITWGVIWIIFEFLYMEFNILRRQPEKNKNKHHLRRHLGSYILLGLEFMIAADIIHTVIQPTKESLTILAAIVGIRTIISYFLHLELKRKI